MTLTPTAGDAAGALRALITGTVTEPADPEYDQARRIWNGMIDPRPALIVRPQPAVDVATAIRFARERDLPIAVRGGGHNVPALRTSTTASSSTCPRSMGSRSIRSPHCHRRGWRHLGPARRGHPAVRAGDAGRRRQRHRDRWADARWRHGLAAPPARAERGQHDRRRSRPRRRADRLDERDPAARTPVGLRGGGGNFGVVTTFEFRLHPIGPEVAFANVFYPLAAAHDVLRAARAVRGRGPGRRYQHGRGLGHIPPH